MRVINSNKYKSIDKFDIELPDFAIFTGKNGSGKSQFLSLLHSALIDNNFYTFQTPNPTMDIAPFDFDDVSFINNNWRLQNLNPVGIVESQQETENLGFLFDEFSKFIHIHPSDKNNYKAVQNKSLFRSISKELNKNPEDITKDEFKRYFRGKYVSSPDEQLTNLKIGIRFYNYYLESLQRKLEGKTEEEFLASYGEPPWIIINRVFEEIDLRFQFAAIENIRLNERYLPQLINDKGEKIQFTDLSSGEKVLMSLVLWIFNSSDYSAFPKVIVLDEPDCHLHPAMAEKLLHVLYDILYTKFGVKIYMSTHSPSTVALAEEGTIYEVNNRSEKVVYPISKDAALEILTEFVPSLSIDYKNHKQVFCESPTDVKYFQALYNKHLKENPKDHKFYFISNSAGESNCADVYSIVEAIRKSGNITSYGIVDWDSRNKPSGYTKVHGEGERWAVENFLLDPIYVIGVLYEAGSFEILKEFGIDEFDNPYALGEKSNQELQELADKFFSKIKEHKRSFDLINKRKIDYYNGRSVELPVEFLMMGKHEFDDIVKKTFVAIGKKYGKGFGLQNSAIKVMARCYPFVPKTSMEFLKNLADS